ncbi:MAG TPA: hypothetical protein VG273_14475 [Bryobacteraceae bacterium]|jgi:hypothetical protein|nr:hypothetical protein [Bryobacteraceae bacterium]
MRYGLLSAGPVLAAALLAGGCSNKPVTLEFPDFPEGVVSLDLGQRVTIEVAAKNDGGKGVTWTCTGDACTTLVTTPTSAKFKALGITGTAKITATSKKQPAVSKAIRIIVGLNETPDLLCRVPETPADVTGD